MSVDEELGLAYLPVELPTGDYYGGNRPGQGLFGETLVCVDLKTGKRKWHYQLVHHGMWDMDISAPPILADITVNGKTIKAIAQPTKQSILYVFDIRQTGRARPGLLMKCPLKKATCQVSGIHPRSPCRRSLPLTAATASR